MGRVMFGKASLLALTSLGLLGASTQLFRLTPREPPPPTQWAQACADFDEWDKPGPPFRIHGNTYYVGTCGISAILINSPGNQVLIDSGTLAGAKIVAGNITRLGLGLREIKALLMSHEHFDHVGGMAWMQEQTGVLLLASKPAAAVMRSGVASKDDPQLAHLTAMKPVKRVADVDEDSALLAAGTKFKPLLTPGHTPGATSWTWQSCEGKECLTIVYADSLNPISAEGYRFSDHPEYVVEFRTSLYRLAALDCDILITPHPGSSDMRKRILGSGLVDQNACMEYAKSALKRLDARLEQERAGAN